MVPSMNYPSDEEAYHIYDGASETLRWWIASPGLVLLALGLIWLFFNRTALRDPGTRSGSTPGGGTARPYSLARVQLWWWTALLLPSWVIVWARLGVLWEFNSTCVALLGLSGTTVVSSRIIDNHDAARNDVRPHQDEASAGFFEDILSDASGVSIHRFQLLVFNIAFGLAFLLETFKPGSAGFPQFDATTLVLLGVSVGTYTASKALENQPPP
jgi:hypothetical protein